SPLSRIIRIVVAAGLCEERPTWSTFRGQRLAGDLALALRRLDQRLFLPPSTFLAKHCYGFSSNLRGSWLLIRHWQIGRWPQGLCSSNDRYSRLDPRVDRRPLYRQRAGPNFTGSPEEFPQFRSVVARFDYVTNSLFWICFRVLPGK